jgi:hypothetical protein
MERNTRKIMPTKLGKHKHAAPDGAWTAPGVRFYKHATPTELIRSVPIPLKTARNQIPPLCCQPRATRKVARGQPEVAGGLGVATSG